MFTITLVSKLVIPNDHIRLLPASKNGVRGTSFSFKMIL